jgi:SAM-dependent methyltransferase
MTSPAGAEFSTFRDPAGFLTMEADRVVRRVRPEYAAATREFLASKLRQQWEARGDMVATTIESDGPDGLVLHHPRLWFATYPWEWTLGQWRAAAELTLKLQQEAIAAGWILKDATPLNILFRGSQAQLVDVLSFEKRDPQSPVWLAYAQFVRTFLLPLIAHKWLHWPLSATSSRRDGFEPHEIFSALPRLRRFRPELLWPVTLPVLLESSAENPENTRKARQMHRDPEITTLVLEKSARGLLKQVRRAAPPPGETAWSKYEATAQHYTAAEIAAKQKFVKAALETANPASVLDVGANTGTYSLMAAEEGAQVLALEADPAAADRIWQRALAVGDSRSGENVLPVVANLAWPTPAYGWENAETHALLERMDKKFDLVLMLAVVHHLLLHDQVPLKNIVPLIARLTRKWLLLEWVPLQDPMFQKLLRGREELYGHLSEEQWAAAAAPYFDQVQREQLSNGRVMLLYKLKA